MQETMKSTNQLNLIKGTLTVVTNLFTNKINDTQDFENNLFPND